MTMKWYNDATTLIVVHKCKQVLYDVWLPFKVIHIIDKYIAPRLVRRHCRNDLWIHGHHVFRSHQPPQRSLIYTFDVLRTLVHSLAKQWIELTMQTIVNLFSVCTLFWNQPTKQIEPQLQPKKKQIMNII